MQRMRRQREPTNSSWHKGHHIDCHSSRDERFFAASHNLHARPRLNSRIQAIRVNIQVPKKLLLI